MCYHTSQTVEDPAIAQRIFRANKVRQIEAFPVYHHLNGFDRGNVSVITQEEPDVIQIAKWSIAPPNCQDIDAYWKRVGGGALNTKIENLFAFNGMPDWKVNAVLRQKCLVLVTGLFKVYTASNGRKIPMYVRKPDGGMFGVLGYYTKQSGILTCSIFTTASDEYFSTFHKRMPFTVDPMDALEDDESISDYYFKLNSEDAWKYEVENARSITLMKYSVNHDVINSHVKSNRNDILEPVDYPELNTLF